jgi:zinc transport system ATP-binding protein
MAHTCLHGHSCPHGQAAVLFENVSVEIGGVSILDNICACAPMGGSTAIVGPNGAGKTTLLLTLLGQMSHKGHIRIAPTKDGRAPRIGYVPQRLSFDRGMPVTVLEFMVMGLQRMPLWFGLGNAPRTRARGLLAAVQAGALENRRLGALSGGEMQRVLLALALQQDPDLLVLDEPAAGVDYQGGNVFCELLESLRQERRFTQVMVSHDLATVTHHATHVICLNRRLAAEGPPREVLTPETLMAIFGIHMGMVNERALPADDATCSDGCCKK